MYVVYYNGSIMTIIVQSCIPMAQGKWTVILHVIPGKCTLLQIISNHTAIIQFLCTVNKK